VIIDVWENEPAIDTELLEMAEIGTAHISGYSLDGKVAGMLMVYDEVCRHFAIAPQTNIQRFMPAVENKEVKIDPRGSSEQQKILETVRKVYDIRSDDAALRGILEEAAEKRGEFFESLRNNYPVRREFFNTEVSLEVGDESLSGKLVGIGFR